MSNIHVEIVTPTSVAFTGAATSVEAPGFEGEFGVMPGHTPFLSVVRPGLVTVHTDGGDQRFVVGTGFVEAGPDRLTVLTEQFERAEDVDKDAARAELVEAEKVLGAADPASGEFKNAQRDADLARARLSV
ncbi:MAG: ATP synthase F1 subunit epsilon [Proteobacteria bacterium]|nr:ATP synthase F1 subunit epsilon [Pseudomonadota bacterium]MCP4918657.1 ATP synthase F1 subunit epsilon [Pseudomonadota bacterium]